MRGGREQAKPVGRHPIEGRVRHPTDCVKAHSGWKRKVPFTVSDVAGDEP